MSQIEVSTLKKIINKQLKVERSTIAAENDSSATPPENTLLELVDVTEDKRDTHDTISLIFHSKGEKYLPQKTYRLSSDEFEARDIFIVPVGELSEGSGTDAKKIGYKYQAIFSKLNKS